MDVNELSACEAYEIQTTETFEKNIQKLVVKKKFKSLPKQIKDVMLETSNGNFEGKLLTHGVTPTPYDVYKLRLPNCDAGVGKSNGYRVIYSVITEHHVVVFLYIYWLFLLQLKSFFQILQ